MNRFQKRQIKLKVLEARTIEEQFPAHNTPSAWVLVLWAFMYRPRFLRSREYVIRREKCEPLYSAREGHTFLYGKNLTMPDPKFKRLTRGIKERQNPSSHRQDRQ